MAFHQVTASGQQMEESHALPGEKVNTLSQKSKLHTQEKHHQAQKEPKDLGGAQATVAEKGKNHLSSSAHFKGVPQSSRPGTAHSPQGPQRVPSATTTAEADSCTRSNARANNHTEEKSRSRQDQEATKNLPRGPLDEKVFMLVHYLLYKYETKEPITKTDMVKNVLQKYKNNFTEILRRASEHLELIFGLDLKEVDLNRHIYVLINKVEASCDARLSDGRCMPNTGLLITILGVIFSKGNCAAEEQVWKVLNMMGLYDGRRHFIFGEPRKLITKDLVQKKYLEYRQVPNSYPPCYEFLWGPRAHVETSKMKVLEFLAKIHNTVPSVFPSWHEEVLKDEEEKTKVRAAARVHTATVVSAPPKVEPSSFPSSNKV
ncbi:LOW QUALITY PROTEIN: melanoma-associated antigen B10-like [Tupaia chinensis]|uniref:LOW QUALITY PROTEIN: melanoma-associated antigen B10-like n=1 Tax=Tupaia chinensis TaxID=246437 RepID=UPI00070468FB|nr:LOW QUALITY PROTEIN: melanoma-associated antigen B10-like [Tupaia chinensis]